MRKSLISQPAAPAADPQQHAPHGLDLDELANVAITSEDEAFPIEHALTPSGEGWRAATTGPQVIRLLFTTPLDLQTLELHFIERHTARSQEFAVFAIQTGRELAEIVRQQFTFSPTGATEEHETYTLNLKSVEALELRIDPDRAHNPADSRAFATLHALRLT